MGRSIRGVIDPELTFQFVEDAPEVDGKHILGKIRGQFFVPGGTSRNDRYYAPEVWEKQLGLDEIKSKLSNRQMFGTIGHEDKINDQNLRDGKMSHITTSLSIDGKKGVGEALILNTQAGSVLNTVLRAGAKMYVSSRADGEYKGTHDGVQSVDPDQFKLEGFDFVLDPGFIEANPGLVESHRKDFDYILGGDAPTDKFQDKEVENNMEKEFVEAYMKENLHLKDEITRMLGEVQSQTARANGLEAEKTVWAYKDKDVNETKAALVEAQEKLKAYESLGSPREIDRAFDVAMKMKESLKDIGSPKEIVTAFDVAEKRLREYKVFGSCQDIGKALSLAKKLLEGYRSLGKPFEINRAFDRAEGFMKKVQETHNRKKVASLSKELGIPEADVKKVMGKAIKEEDIKSLAKSIRESAKTKERFGVRSSEKKVDAGGSDDGDSSKKVDFGESNLDRLGRHFNKTVPTSRKKSAIDFQHPLNS